MSIERVASLEGRVERLAMALEALQRQVAALAQQLWQQAGRGGGFGGGGIRRIRIDAGIGAGAIGAPDTADAYLLLPDGSDGQRIDLNNEFGTAVTGSAYGWAAQDGSTWYLVQADC
jgi:hypothetical protein